VMHLLDSNFQMVSARFLAAAISTKEDVWYVQMDL
jgi:hypothetical protein